MHARCLCCAVWNSEANYLLLLWLQAASRHQCLYLVRLHAQEFLLQGGDAQWLRGLDYAPQKLRNLCEVITILAHKPWLIKTEHIEVGIEGVVYCVCVNYRDGRGYKL